MGEPLDPDVPVRSSASDHDVFAGSDRVVAIVDAVTVAVVSLLLIPVARLVHAPWWALVAATPVAVALAAGGRYRLSIGAEGIELVALRAWIVPARRSRWLLDAKVDLYESWEADAPEGIYVQSRAGAKEPDSPCFGPTGEARIRALQSAAAASLARWRERVPPCPPALRHPLLGPQAGALDLARAARTPAGRLREATSVTPVRLGGLVLAAGSRFRLNDDAFLDPRRDDRLIEVETAGSVVVHGFVAKPGAVLSFVDDEPGVVAFVRRGFDREIEIQGLPVRGDEGIGFTKDGALVTFMLARAAKLAGFEIPAGSQLHRTPGWTKVVPAAWICQLAGQLRLPQTTLLAGESCQLSDDLGRLVGISPRQDLSFPEGRVRAGVRRIPVTPDGRVDLKGCREKSLLV